MDNFGIFSPPVGTGPCLLFSAHRLLMVAFKRSMLLYRPASSLGIYTLSGLMVSGVLRSPLLIFHPWCLSGWNRIWPVLSSKLCFPGFLSSPANRILANHFNRYRKEVSGDRHLISWKISHNSSFYTQVAAAKINITMVSSFSGGKCPALLRRGHSPVDFHLSTISWPVCVTSLLNVRVYVTYFLIRLAAIFSILKNLKVTLLWAWKFQTGSFHPMNKLSSASLIACYIPR